MNVQFLGSIPIEPEIVECGDNGTPYAHRVAERMAVNKYAEIVGRIIAGSPVKQF